MVADIPPRKQGFIVSHPKINANGGYVVARQESAVPESRQKTGFSDTTIPQQHHLCCVNIVCENLDKIAEAISISRDILYSSLSYRILPHKLILNKLYIKLIPPILFTLLILI